MSSNYKQLPETQQLPIFIGPQLSAASLSVVIAADQTPIPVIASFASTDDTNYGVVGANTLRTASQIGNATGAASFGAGSSGAQTLRVSANITRNGTELSYNSGTVDANTLRVIISSDQSAIPASQSGTWSVRLQDGSGTIINSTSNALNVNVQNSSLSVKLQDGAGTALTSTLNNSKQSLDVFPNVAITSGSTTRPAVTNSSASILASNASRKYAYVFNQTGAVVFITLGSTAVVNQGIRLANNDFYEITADNLWTGAINAIKSAAASVNLDVFEGT